MRTSYMDAGVLERLRRLVDDFLRHLRIRRFGADLQRIVGRIEVRQRVDEPDEDHDQNRDIAPH